MTIELYVDIELLNAGMIEESSSPWRHNPLVVLKSDGSSRMTIKYKPVNAITSFDAFPLAKADDLLWKLNGATVFSSIDFSQFYHQLPLAESDKEKTAFVADGKLYHFKRCPFGLKNAVAYCCRTCLLYTSPSPRDRQKSRMPSSA